MPTPMKQFINTKRAFTWTQEGNNFFRTGIATDAECNPVLEVVHGEHPDSTVRLSFDEVLAICFDMMAHDRKLREERE